MSEEKELKLACLHQAGGDLDHAQRLFDWVSGSVRATPDSEAAEVSAPKQDKPQQSFNYRHPSKYGTDVPRRCYLEELTPEERAIRDLVDTVERLGAHPLLTATVIQLMKAGEDLADWVDIGLRDKAIAALSPGNDLGLLDENPETASPEFAIEQGVPIQIVHEERWPYSVSYTIAESGFGSGAYEHLYQARDDFEAFKLEPKYLTVVLKHRGKVIDTFARPIGADVPEDDRDETWAPPPGYTYIPTQGERCVCVNLMQDGIGNFFCCNQRGEATAEAERISVVTDQDRVEQADLLLENQPGVSSQASSTEATRKAELEEANRGEIIRKIAAANAYHEVRFGDRWRVGSELENQPGVSDEGTPVLDAWPEVNGGSMLIVDDLPTMKRADLPLDAETFKGHGIETARVNGVTYLVTDEPERIAETSPAQAYDTAHEEAEPSIDAERTPESQSTDGIDRVEQQSPAAYGGWVFWKRSA